MYAKRYRSRQPRRPFLRKPLRKKVVTRRPRVSPSLNQAIKTVIRRNEETKSQSFSSNDASIGVYNTLTGSLTNLNINNVFSLVTQGVGQGQRVGNKIAPTSLKLHGFISCENAQVLTNAYFRLVMLKYKPANDPPLTGTYAGLFQTGSTQSSPTGTLLDLMRDFNKDLWTIYASKVLGPFGSVASVYSTMASSQTVIAKRFTFDLSKHCKSVSYNDTTSDPTNFAMRMVILPCNADGTQIVTAQVANFSYTYDIELKYKDA